MSVTTWKVLGTFQIMGVRYGGGYDSTPEMTLLGDCFPRSSDFTLCTGPCEQGRIPLPVWTGTDARTGRCWASGGHVIPGLGLPLRTWEAARLARLTATQQAPAVCCLCEERPGLPAPHCPQHLQEKGTGEPRGWAQVPHDGAWELLFHMKSC